VVHFTNGKDTASGRDSRPKGFPYMLDSIQSNTIKVELFCEPLDPIGQVVDHLLVLSVNIGKGADATVFDGPLIIIVNDAWGMKVGLVIQRRCESLCWEFSRVIQDNISHDPNIARVGLSDKFLEPLWATKLGIYCVKVFRPVPMIATLSVVNRRRNVNRVEAHSLNVVELLGNSYVRVELWLSVSIIHIMLLEYGHLEKFPRSSLSKRRRVVHGCR
jgi:hypothetical protein